MHNQQNWDHLRYVLAVAEAGSVSQAARNLGVNHATVLRHVAAFEDKTGAEIFDKSATGYTVHDDRMRVIEAAREVETAVQAVQQIIAGARAPVRGTVRVTSTDSFCQVVLPPLIGAWQSQLDELRIELVSTNARLDFSRLRADIAVRPTERLDDDLRGVAAARLGFDIYHGVDFDSDRWLGFSGNLSRTGAAQWMAHHIPGEQISGSADSFVALRELAAWGLGRVILPCAIADNDPRLQRQRGLLPDMAVDIWVASHADLVDVPRIKVVRDLLVSALAQDSARLAGLS